MSTEKREAAVERGVIVGRRNASDDYLYKPKTALGAGKEEPARGESCLVGLARGLVRIQPSAPAPPFLMCLCSVY